MVLGTARLAAGSSSRTKLKTQPYP